MTSFETFTVCPNEEKALEITTNLRKQGIKTYYFHKPNWIVMKQRVGDFND